MAARASAQPVQLYRMPPRQRTEAPAMGDDCVVALRALGEDTRVRIIGLLMAAPMDVSEVSESVGISHYNASKHLKVLRHAGLLQLKKVGRRHLYTLTAGIRRRAKEGDVLDLGCCSFKFDPSQSR